MQNKSKRKLEGIGEIRDESDKDGMRETELKKGEVAEVVLNNLIKNLQLEQVFGINNVVNDGNLRYVNLQQLLNIFLIIVRIQLTISYELDKQKKEGIL